MIVHYRKSQVSNVIVAVTGAGIIILGNIMWAFGCSCSLWAVIALLAVVMLLFSALTVEVGEDAVTAKYGLGWPKRSIPFRRIRSVRPMEIPWYFGWGVRWIPRGWMFRGSGTAVIELQFEDERRFCIGTPEPKELTRIIEAAMGRGNG
jgi:uncharacterized membrane protein